MAKAARYVPSKEDIDRLKAAASREAVPRCSVGAVLLQPALRCHKDQPDREAAINIALVSDDPEFNDTDLSDYGAWQDFRRGIPLTEDGRAIVDFYIRRRFDEHDELLGNVTIEVTGGKLARVYGYGNKSDYFNVGEGA